MKLFLLLILSPFIDARYFRNDYEYFNSVNGWMKLHRVPANWNEARLRCHYEGAILASPSNDELLQTMKAVIGQTQHKLNVFTGISSVFSSGDYFTIDGHSIENLSVSWAPGEPDNIDDNEHCIMMYSNGNFADKPCAETHPYICYKSNSQDIPTPDKCGTVDTEYIFDDRTSHCYKFHRYGETWSRAFMICAAEGGYLAIINSEKESQVLRDIFAKHPPPTIYSKLKDIAAIGFHSWHERASYSWLTVHGQTLKEAGYETWAPGQPDNATAGEYCGAIFRSAQLDDVWCDTPVPFICEKPPGSLLDNNSGSTDEVQRE